jgi:hypothetical protein
LTALLEVPASTQRFIIGAKGATLKQIQTLSGTRITVPKREKTDAVPESAENVDDAEADDVAVPITIIGDADGVKIAKAEIMKIVGEKVKIITDSMFLIRISCISNFPCYFRLQLRL